MVWIKWREKLIHDYSLAGYLLSPNSTIMAHAYKNRSTMYNEAVVRLIGKLILNPMLVGEEKSSHLSKDGQAGMFSSLQNLGPELPSKIGSR
jgi:hypothetical protein